MALIAPVGRQISAGCKLAQRGAVILTSRNRFQSSSSSSHGQDTLPLSTLQTASRVSTVTDTVSAHRVACYARAVRKHQNVTFLTIADGTSIDASTAVQAVLRKELKAQFDHQLTPGVALEIVGQMKRASKARQQSMEFDIEALKVTGTCDSASYPIRLVEASTSEKKLDSIQSSTDGSAERLRRYAHLRPRDTRHAAVLRARDSLERAISGCFHRNQFIRVAAPIVTSSDCEGGGEVFRVEADATVAKESNESFWSDSKAYLTVSAQLHLEAMALGLGRVYTVGPSFRAEGSATNRHLAEFWMCEGEQLTSQDCALAMDEVTGVVEDVIKAAMKAVLTESSELSLYLWHGYDEARTSLLEMLALDRWERLSYTQAIDQLQKAPLTTPAPIWGDSLTSEQERWLARDAPIFVTDYPANQKPFYMRLNQDDKTAACFDLLVPRLGELVGGSLRETRSETLHERLGNASREKLSWYVEDLRRFGCNPHGGFGIGVERLLSWLTNTESVRDVVTFPRVKGPLHF